MKSRDFNSYLRWQYYTSHEISRFSVAGLQMVISSDEWIQRQPRHLFILLMLTEVHQMQCQQGMCPVLHPTLPRRFRDSQRVNLGNLPESLCWAQGWGKIVEQVACKLIQNERRSFKFQEVQGQDNVYFLHICKGVLFFDSFLNFKGRISFCKNAIA